MPEYEPICTTSYPKPCEVDCLGRMREVNYVRSNRCEVQDCHNPISWQIQFKDGLWMDVCDKHKPEVKGSGD